jgi:uncharacterized SAM-binding protein YcdF (DUF218 family)
MGKWRALAVLLLLLWFASRSGAFLVVDAPLKSDIIVVLAGETDRRPTHALELLSQGYAHQMILDVPGGATAYGTSYVDLARRWMEPLPQASMMTICPIYGLSTKAEAQESYNCIRQGGGSSVLIVTSDYHTRRALSIFRHNIHDVTFSVAAARDENQFGEHWWRRRQWAKTNLEEWLRLLWWEFVDRWS